MAVRRRIPDRLVALFDVPQDDIPKPRGFELGHPAAVGGPLKLALNLVAFRELEQLFPEGDDEVSIGERLPAERLICGQIVKMLGRRQNATVINDTERSRLLLPQDERPIRCARPVLEVQGEWCHQPMNAAARNK